MNRWRLAAPAMPRLTLAVLLPAFAVLLPAHLAAASPSEPADCAACHPAEVQAWRSSHHSRAMQVATPDTVLGDFDSRTFRDASGTTEFQRAGMGYQLRATGADGRQHDYVVRYTFGLAPLQQYLVELPGGRLQAYPVAWDTRPRASGGHRWFSLYPGQRVLPGDPLHWSGPNQNWNSMCADCHSTGVRKHWDAASHRYSTTWGQVAVACAACHGEADSHLKWVRQGQAAEPHHGFAVSLREPGGTWGAHDQRGIRRLTGPARQGHAEQVCSGCHARRRTLTEEQSGADFLARYSPALLDETLYVADGQIQGEVFEYGSFQQSRMHAAGVTCNDCHEPHGTALRHSGNALCGECHLPQRFDAPAHHHHATGSAAGQCIACHMPARTYMQVHVRHDHGFQVPRPARSHAVGAPDPCTACHASRSADWAQQALRRWKQDDPRPDEKVAATLAAGRRDPERAVPRLWALARDVRQAPIRRATALALLATVPASSGTFQPEPLAALLADAQPLVRLGALRVLAHRAPGVREYSAARMLADPERAVRTEAARLLPYRPSPSLNEWIAAEQLASDRPEALLNLGVLSVEQARTDSAERAFQAALRLDPDWGPALLDLADLYRATGRDAQAGPLLERAVKRDPGLAGAHFALALWLIRQQRGMEADAHLRAAARLDPADPRIAQALGLYLRQQQ